MVPGQAGLPQQVALVQRRGVSGSGQDLEECICFPSKEPVFDSDEDQDIAYAVNARFMAIDSKSIFTFSAHLGESNGTTLHEKEAVLNTRRPGWRAG